MTLRSDPCISDLNREWEQVRLQQVPPDWPFDADSLGAVLDGISRDPDHALGQLLALQAAGSALAGRVVLQAMLGKLVLMAARDQQHSAGDYVAECWLQLRHYPLLRRPRRIAANLALDTRRAVRAASARFSPAALSLDPMSFDALALQPKPDTVSLIRLATRLGLIDRAAGASLVAVYCLGLRSHEAAQHLAISADLVRWRNARAIRRLAAHATTLAAIA